jgi:hypothetical protein
VDHLYAYSKIFDFLLKNTTIITRMLFIFDQAVEENLYLRSPVNRGVYLHQQQEQQQPSARLPLLQASTSTDTDNMTPAINADMAASALDSSVSNTSITETSENFLPSSVIAYQGQQGMHEVPIISETASLFPYKVPTN